jgi:hypothetical protein
MKTLNRLSSALRPLLRTACSLKALRLHPKLRWLNHACPVLERIESPPSRCPHPDPSGLRVLGGSVVKSEIQNPKS